MWLTLLALVSIADWIPARWNSTDPQSLKLVAGTAINCLWVTLPSAEFAAAAKAQGIDTLLFVPVGSEISAQETLARKSGMAGMVVDQNAGVQLPSGDSGFVVIALPSRYELGLKPSLQLAATWQGVWPGVNQTEEDTAKAAPSGAPWIDTNSGFLRFVRAWTAAPVWIANKPPEKAVINPVRYLQAIGDAAVCGARWVISLDADFESKLLAGDEKTMAAWKKITDLLAFIEQNKHWRMYRPSGQMAVVQDATSGALLSGGILDMISVKHTPVQPVPNSRLSAKAMEGAKMAVNVNPTGLSDAERAVMTAFARSGGTVLAGPPGWKFPPPRPGQLTVDEAEVKKLDEIWKELNTMTGRRNLGVRLFNVASMLSNLLDSPDGKQRILHLVNYSDFPAESVTAHVLGTWTKATLLSPNGPPRKLETYVVEEGTGVDVPLLHTFGTIVLE